MDDRTKNHAEIANNILENFDEKAQFNDDIENRLFAMLVEVLLKKGPAIALSYRTLEKYSIEDALRETGVSKEDEEMLSDTVKSKIRIMYVFQKVVMEREMKFNDVKKMEVNPDTCKSKVVEAADDIKNLRVVFKILEKRLV